MTTQQTTQSQIIEAVFSMMLVILMGRLALSVTSEYGKQSNPAERGSVTPEVTAKRKALSVFADRGDMWVTGSFATGKATAKSDLDIIVVVSDLDDIRNVRRIEQEILAVIPDAHVFFSTKYGKPIYISSRGGGEVPITMWKTAKPVVEVAIPKAEANKQLGSSNPRIEQTTHNRETIAYKRWQQLKQYLHTIDDVKRIANRQGTIKLYHGAPTEFAELLVTQGPRVPYRVEDTGRYVARVYGIPWMEFRPYAYRAHEVVKRLSTAPVAIAARWAWTFPLGEILTDLNAHARMFVAFKEKARREGIGLDDAYDQLYEEAIQVARGTGARCTTESAPDVLGLPDKLALQKKTGALVEIDVNARALPERIVREAVIRLGYIDKGEITERETVLYWNHEYTDIKVAAENVRSPRIVISGMESWEQDLVEDIIRKELAEE